MLKAVCQNTLPFHSHRKITTRFDGGSLTHFTATERSRRVLMEGASLPTQDGCCLDPWIVNIDCARASVRVLRKVETDATFVMTC